MERRGRKMNVRESHLCPTRTCYLSSLSSACGCQCIFSKPKPVVKLDMDCYATEWDVTQSESMPETECNDRSEAGSQAFIWASQTHFNLARAESHSVTHRTKPQLNSAIATASLAPGQGNLSLGEERSCSAYSQIL